MHKPFTFFKRTGKHGSTWYVRFRDPDTGKRLIAQSTGETRRAAAELWALFHMPKTSEALRATKTFGDFARRFFEWGQCDWIARQHADGKSFTWGTAQVRRGHVVNYLLPAFENRPLASITGLEIANWLAKLELASGTRNGVRLTLSIIMKDAVLGGFIPVDPCAAVPAPSKRGRERGILTISERTALFPSDRDELLAIWGDAARVAAFMVLMTTGIRSGELRALQWRHLVRDRKTVLLIENAVKHGGTIGGTKSGTVRAVLLTGRALADLDWWRSVSPFTADDDFMFCRLRGKPVGTDWLDYGLTFALGKARINVGDRRICVHSFRHGFNTMARTTLPAETLRFVLGHASESMSQHYDHPQIEDLLTRIEGAAPVIERMFDGKPS